MKKPPKKSNKLPKRLSEEDVTKCFEYKSLLKEVLPRIKKDEDKIVLAEIMLVLKMNGLVGKELSDKDSKMIKFVKDLILETPGKKNQALFVAEDIINSEAKDG